MGCFGGSYCFFYWLFLSCRGNWIEIHSPNSPIVQFNTPPTQSSQAQVFRREPWERVWLKISRRLDHNLHKVIRNSFVRVYLFLGSPSPPSNLQISDLDCNELTLKLSWTPGASNGAPIDYYLIDMESSGIPVVFLLIHNVTDPEVTEIVLNLTRRSVPRFRMIAFNKFGSSRPSTPTAEGICGTKAAKTSTGITTINCWSELGSIHRTDFFFLLNVIWCWVLTAYRCSKQECRNK